MRRYAIYYTPRPAAELTERAAAWLGRDIHAARRQAPVGPADLVALPSRYGFHATLKAPFELAPNASETELSLELASFAAKTPGVVVPDLGLARIGNFLALVPADPSSDIDHLAEKIVRAFDGFRAPLTETQLRRRNPSSLSPGQQDHLLRWGYPYVIDQFRFHMTLTGKVHPDAQTRVRSQLADHFGNLLPLNLIVDQIALVIEESPGADFRVHSNYDLAAPVMGAER